MELTRVPRRDRRTPPRPASSPRTVHQRVVRDSTGQGDAAARTVRGSTAQYPTERTERSDEDEVASSILASPTVKLLRRALVALSLAGAIAAALRVRGRGGTPPQHGGWQPVEFPDR